MNYNREFKSFKEQVLLLKSRGLEFKGINEIQAENILSHINYYKLSNYVKAFEISKDTYSGTDFGDVIELYNFDRELSRILFELIEKIEISFKTSLAYITSEYIINSAKNKSPFAYLNIKNWYDKSNIRNNSDLLKKELEFKEKITSYSSKNPRDCVQYYFDKYSKEHFIPIWILMEIIDFGVSCQMFKNACTEIKELIAKKYNIYNHNDFLFYMNILKFIRNKLAHNSYIWNLNLINKINKPIIKPIDKFVDNGRVFSVIIIIKELLKTIEPTYDYTVLGDLINNFFSKYPDLLIKFGIRNKNIGLIKSILI